MPGGGARRCAHVLAAATYVGASGQPRAGHAAYLPRPCSKRDDAHRPGRIPRIARHVLAAERVVVLDDVADLLPLAPRAATALLPDVGLGHAASAGRRAYPCSARRRKARAPGVRRCLRAQRLQIGASNPLGWTGRCRHSPRTRCASARRGLTRSAEGTLLLRFTDPRPARRRNRSRTAPARVGRPRVPRSDRGPIAGADGPRCADGRVDASSACRSSGGARPDKRYGPTWCGTGRR
jgi:hypothetical protein